MVTLFRILYLGASRKIRFTVNFSEITLPNFLLYRKSSVRWQFHILIKDLDLVHQRSSEKIYFGIINAKTCTLECIHTEIPRNICLNTPTHSALSWLIAQTDEYCLAFTSPHLVYIWLDAKKNHKWSISAKATADNICLVRVSIHFLLIGCIFYFCFISYKYRYSIYVRV